MKFPKKKNPRTVSGHFSARCLAQLARPGCECGPRRGPATKVAQWPRGGPGQIVSGAPPAPIDAITAPSAPAVARHLAGHKGPGVAHPIGRAQGSDNGCVWQSFTDRGLPVGSGDSEAATDDDAKEFIDDNSTLVAPGGDRDLLQQWGRGGSEVQPIRAKGAARVELTEMAEGGGGRFRNAMRGGGSPVTDMDERPRGERGWVLT
jgi:hypothetical protein